MVRASRTAVTKLSPVVTKGPEVGSLSYRAEVRIDEAVEVTNRDVILVWNYQSPTRFYYAHLSTDNTIYPHNGIFVVNDADRLRIDDQWDGTVGAEPSITDADWHDVRLDYDARSGAIAVYLDGSDEAQMMLDEGKRRVVETLDACQGRNLKDPEKVKKQIIETLSRYFSERTRRKPVQLVVLQQMSLSAPMPPQQVEGLA